MNSTAQLSETDTHQLVACRTSACPHTNDSELCSCAHRRLQLRDALADGSGTSSAAPRLGRGRGHGRLLAVAQNREAWVLAEVLHPVDVPTRVRPAHALASVVVPIQHRILRPVATMARAEVPQHESRRIGRPVAAPTKERLVVGVGEVQIWELPSTATVKDPIVVPAGVAAADALAVVPGEVQNGECRVWAIVAAAQPRQVRRARTCKAQAQRPHSRPHHSLARGHGTDAVPDTN
mmetsp:Transcript_13006/g.35428  ORF Transcript_13006/g.35428 Transcript_13006/m.35428 type:complete len:236 (+) Transcript_13006:98-805(+)